MRTPSSDADAMAAGAAAMPPAPITPTNANCDPPVNMNRLSTQVCQTSRPDATASAPNEMPYALVASATPSPCARGAAGLARRVRVVEVRVQGHPFDATEPRYAGGSAARALSRERGCRRFAASACSGVGVLALHARGGAGAQGLVELDLADADDLGGDLDAFVVAGELEALLER